MASELARPLRQTRKASFIEAWVNIFVGYLIQVYVLYLVAPLFGFTISFQTSALIGGIMTIVSFIRQYSLRRLFESMRHYGMLP